MDIRCAKSENETFSSERPEGLDVGRHAKLSEGLEIDTRYKLAFLDWLACALAGVKEEAAQAAKRAGKEVYDQVLVAGTAGHVLDFDDTYGPGLAHLSAPTAPAALVLGARVGATIGEVLQAYAAGFEAMGRLARASHPELYDRGWHPTAVCGVVGSATAAARILKLEDEPTSVAVRIALLRAGGLRAAFGSDGKSLQVGMAAATGIQATRLAEAGATIPEDLPTAPAGFERVYGAAWAENMEGRPSVEDNWIKAYPCCLQTHAPIEAAELARQQGASTSDGVTVIVHPVSLQAAAYENVETGLQAKFSIPYTVAYTLLFGPPELKAFVGVDDDVRRAAQEIDVVTDPEFLESEAVVVMGTVRTRIEAAIGSPQRPMDAAALASKVRLLAGERLDGVLDDAERPARDLVEIAGF